MIQYNIEIVIERSNKVTTERLITLDFRIKYVKIRCKLLHYKFRYTKEDLYRNSYVVFQLYTIRVTLIKDLSEVYIKTTGETRFSIKSRQNY